MALKPFISPLTRVSSPDVVTRTARGESPAAPVQARVHMDKAAAELATPFHDVTSSNA